MARVIALDAQDHGPRGVYLTSAANLNDEVPVLSCTRDYEVT